MVALLMVIGVSLILYGIWAFVKGVNNVWKCVFFYLFASEERIDKEFEDALRKTDPDYTDFEDELSEMLND